jgi:hypothetical protein
MPALMLKSKQEVLDASSMARPLNAFGSEATGGSKALMPPVLLELPANFQRVSTAALQGATALAYIAACGQPIAAARGGTVVHSRGTGSHHVVSSVVQLLLEIQPVMPPAQHDSIAATAQPEASLAEVLHEDTAAQTLPAAPECSLPVADKAVGSGSAARHTPGQWRQPPPPEDCAAAGQQLKPKQPRAWAMCAPLQLAHAIQAAHASPAALNPDDPMHLAALLLPRKAGPPRLLRRLPAKRSSDQLQGAVGGGSGLPVRQGAAQQLSRVDALRLRLQQAKRPAWAKPTTNEHDEQEQDLLNFVSDL